VHQDNSKSKLNGLSERRLRAIRESYDSRGMEFIVSMMNDDHAFIADTARAFRLRNQGIEVDEENFEGLGVEDYLLYSRIEFLFRESPADLEACDKFHVVGEDETSLLRNQQEYLILGASWVAGERALLKRQLEQRGLKREPTTSELEAHALQYKTPQRFRTFYYMKYPERMREETEQ
jgi:hypothetical protein